MAPSLLLGFLVEVFCRLAGNTAHRIRSFCRRLGSFKRCDLDQALARAFLYAQSAANAFIVIDDRDAAIDTVFHGDGLFRAVLCAQSAADAGNAAVSHSGFAFFTVVALDQNLVRSLHHFNEELRARGGTGIAANAFIIVELGQAIFSHGQGAEAAGINAGATAKAAKVALARAASGSRGEEAVLDAFPFVFGRAVFFAPIAVETGNHADGIFVVVSCKAHHRFDGLFVFGSTGCTFHGAFFLAGDDGICHGSTASIAAAAAVGARQEGQDFILAGIFFNGQFLAGDGKDGTEDAA